MSFREGQVRYQMLHLQPVSSRMGSDGAGLPPIPIQWQSAAMAGTQPFEPDDIYCVYCHAIASGPCAVCGALCCGDCVELVMGLTLWRATCRSCLEQGRRPTRLPMALRVVLGLAALAVLTMVALSVR
jgi:hypothetical protein